MADLSPEALDAFLVSGVKWSPQPLRRYERPEPYPVESLPPLVRDAVEEVGGYVQAPVALVAASALSAVSTSVQTRFSVQRDAALSGPASLYLLTVAESGERKSTVDKLFTAPIREWEAKQAQTAKELMAEYEAALEDWENEGASLASDLKHGLHPDPGRITGIDPRVRHDLSKPEPPIVPRVLRGDDTPEALAKALAEYPVAAVISAEAGVIFGSHGMSAENVTRNLAQANAMWDGDAIDQGRIGRDRVRVEGMRVTMGLQVQPAVLKSFMDRTGGLMRGIGYFARFLFSHPESTQGSRYYVEPPADMPALRAFHHRVTTLMDMPAEFDAFGRLLPHYVSLDRQAHECWFRFHDEVEELMGADFAFAGIRDVASKAADNAARLACCLHVFGNRTEPTIGQDTMADACKLMRWYLDEAVRFSRAHDMTDEVRHAEMLEEWLVRQVRERRGDITVNAVRQKGPGALRVRAKLDAAIELLEDHGRIRVIKPAGTKKRYVHVAPAVVAEWS